jgi:hypothetical protein
MIKSSQKAEAGVMPSKQLITEMVKFNDEMVKAGVMLDGQGLMPSFKGARVRWGGGKVRVIDGPFAESKELIAGYWLLETKSLAEAIEWIRRAPNPDNQDGEVELRQIFEAEDFGPEFTPEARAMEDRQRAALAQRKELDKKR